MKFYHCYLFTIKATPLTDVWCSGCGRGEGEWVGQIG